MCSLCAGRRPNLTVSMGVGVGSGALTSLRVLPCQRQQDEGYPNIAVERLLRMDSDELSQDMDRVMEEA